MNKHTCSKALLSSFLLFAVLCAVLSSKSLERLPEGASYHLSAQQGAHEEVASAIDDKEVPLAGHAPYRCVSLSTLPYGIVLFAITTAVGLSVFVANELHLIRQSK